MTGLISAWAPCPSSSPTTISLSATPTCGAARPMPTSSYIVSIMSRMTERSSGVTSPTGSERRRSTGSPYSGSSKRPFDRIHHDVYDTAAFPAGPPELLERRADERRQLGGALHDDPPYAVPSGGARRIDPGRRRGPGRRTDPARHGPRARGRRG